MSKPKPIAFPCGCRVTPDGGKWIEWCQPHKAEVDAVHLLWAAEHHSNMQTRAARADELAQ